MKPFEAIGLLNFPKGKQEIVFAVTKRSKMVCT